MAVEKAFRCDLNGEYVARHALVVLRVGTPDQRPDECQRVDVCPDCHDQPVSAVVAAAERLAAKDEEPPIFPPPPPLTAGPDVVE